MADRSNVYALIGVIVIIGVLTFVFTRDLSTSAQAVASEVFEVFEVRSLRSLRTIKKQKHYNLRKILQ